MSKKGFLAGFGVLGLCALCCYHSIPEKEIRQ
jgi:hypothetical protein